MLFQAVQWFHWVHDCLRKLVKFFIFKADWVYNFSQGISFQLSSGCENFIGFQNEWWLDWLECNLNNDNEWLHVCSLFVLFAKACLSFGECCHKYDVITITLIYQYQNFMSYVSDWPTPLLGACLEIGRDSIHMIQLPNVTNSLNE